MVNRIILLNGICMDGIKRILRVIVFLGVIFVGGVLRVAGQGSDSLVDVSPRKFVHGWRVDRSIFSRQVLF